MAQQVRLDYCVVLETATFRESNDDNVMIYLKMFPCSLCLGGVA